jgi:hypothetical protein
MRKDDMKKASSTKNKAENKDENAKNAGKSVEPESLMANRPNSDRHTILFKLRIQVQEESSLRWLSGTLTVTTRNFKLYALPVILRGDGAHAMVARTKPGDWLDCSFMGSDFRAQVFSTSAPATLSLHAVDIARGVFPAEWPDYDELPALQKRRETA